MWHLRRDSNPPYFTKNTLIYNASLMFMSNSRKLTREANRLRIMTKNIAGRGMSPAERAEVGSGAGDGAVVVAVIFAMDNYSSFFVVRTEALLRLVYGVAKSS